MCFILVRSGVIRDSCRNENVHTDFSHHQRFVQAAPCQCGCCGPSLYFLRLSSEKELPRSPSTPIPSRYVSLFISTATALLSFAAPQIWSHLSYGRHRFERDTLYEIRIHCRFPMNISKKKIFRRHFRGATLEVSVS
jgi:hypothetical protein